MPGTVLKLVFHAKYIPVEKVVIQSQVLVKVTQFVWLKQDSTRRSLTNATLFTLQLLLMVYTLPARISHHEPLHILSRLNSLRTWLADSVWTFICLYHFSSGSGASTA